MWKELTTNILGERGDAEVPDRVKEAVATQQRQGEFLIGWVQLALVIVFGSFYLIAPKTFSEDVPFEPVPVVLGLYLLFTVGRLLAARWNWLPTWFLALSVVIDMSLLFGLIWSFHIQYSQPLALFLKAPTMLYIFIFITLRALRFDARFVLIAGLVAAAGWGMMIALSVGGMMIGNRFTRDYVDYLTSANVLLGAEMDKILAILAVTGILALALVRAQRLLEQSVAEGEAARDLSRFFAPEVADMITRAKERIGPGEGELRQAAILMCDLRGFTLYARTRPPQEVMSVLGNYEARMVPIIRAHGGSVDKFLGDGILASFGAAKSSETFAADALRAMDDILAEGEKWALKRIRQGRKPLHIGAAVAVGEVVFGAVGTKDRMEYTVIGDAVNLAAKLEKQNKKEGTRGLTTVEAHQLAVAQGYERLMERSITGAAVEGTRETVDMAVMME